ncbi:MAG: hypothetical protein US96_C0030G0019 [Candidatus Woesebacteria bacterium GW2011_GWB1_38_5b]|uniref:Uncharacterized protein n=1 Tax=Candidatus Woesebacteria bacterium GW2011_GWB1_38_5b TaxID=1618569 RepID=A0A0G0MLD3_9BACT|nr:MAG: hypothetical protein US96_C0030G0019 [Candidatus Woesebacteria bacterium GW2011_GWB1_38_5b]
MKNSTQKPTKTRLYKDAPLSKDSINELAERWVELMIEMLLAKDKEGLQKYDEFSKLETA